MTKRAVYVVDDEEPIRKSLGLMLTVQGYAPTAFDSGPALLDMADALRPGCVLLDVRMPEMDGIEVQRRLGERRGDLPVIVMTGHGDLTVAVNALASGAIAFVEKPFPKKALKRALDAAFLKLEDPQGYRRQLESFAVQVATLGQEDKAVLAQMALGRANDVIAAELGVQVPAVELCRARLFAALDIENANEAAMLAFAAGLGIAETYATIPRDAGAAHGDKR